ncbi:MAG: hypothetical protein DRI71_02605 [Bacteroidetes bacterium]|nr:MAG: hypothetical protein DRI71_02605 [Bacteroidota bacterium]
MQRKIFLKAVAFVFGLIALGLMSQQFFPGPPSPFEPILMTRTDMEAAVAMHEPREIESPGKIWVYNNYILLIEKYKGIHIIDNSDPANSHNVAFIQVDGCTDLAVKDDVIFTNNAVDMIGVKVNANFSTAEVVSRNKYILPIISSPEPWSDWYFIQMLPSNMIIVQWVPYSND